MKKHLHSVHTIGRIPQATTERYAGPHVGAMAANAVPAVSRSYFEGGYFDGSDKAHYLVEDYRGNIVRDCRADGTVVASTEYYPYGEPRTEPAGDNRKWTEGNERLSSSGLPVTDYGPRLMDHARIGWSRPDRLLESTPWLSPYSYCDGNPVAHSDPSGDYFYLCVAGSTYIYQDGDFGWDFYNDRGERCPPTVFYRNIVIAFDIINSSLVGRTLLSILANSATAIKLENSDFSFFNSKEASIHWQPLNSNKFDTHCVTPWGDVYPTYVNSVMALVHEMFHAESYLYGYEYKPENVWFSYKDKDGKDRNVYTDEIWAVKGENFVRSDLSLYLRAGYGYIESTGDLYMPLYTSVIENRFTFSSPFKMANYLYVRAKKHKR